VCIDARCLWGDISADTHHLSAELISNFECVDIQILRRPYQQGIEEFDQRWDDQFVAPGLVQIEQVTPK
jgi:hypothetical protein